MRVKIHHEGTNILIILAVALLIVLLPLWLWVDVVAVPITATVVLGVFYLLVVNFFRSPKRQFTGNPENVVVSSAAALSWPSRRYMSLNILNAAAYSCRCL